MAQFNPSKPQIYSYTHDGRTQVDDMGLFGGMPDFTIYDVCDEFLSMTHTVSRICDQYPHLLTLINDAHQFADNACRLAAVRGVTALEYYELSKM